MSTTLTEAINQKINLENLQTRRVHIAVFGHGNVGSEFLRQLYTSKKELKKRRHIELQVIAIANSKTLLLSGQGIGQDWDQQKRSCGQPYKLKQIIDFVNDKGLENLIAIDTTANEEFTNQYAYLIRNGFHLVASNKYKNTQPWKEYCALRSILTQYDKSYYYETNVGAGLPLIDTIKLLHQSGENITRIRGVFSGSLSFLFNKFSENELPFSAWLHKAITNGFTEPDPREDLSGTDVARKLLILARELDLRVNLEEVEVQNLIPKRLRTMAKKEFLTQVEELDVYMLKRKKNLKKGSVLRYVGDLHGDLSKIDGAILQVNLQEIPKNSMLGQLKGSDSIFEIYTESYGTNPLIIQGAGAGAAVTARGVYGDVLRICNQLVY